MTGNETLDDIAALLPAYALNALDPAEREQVERALEEEPSYREALGEYLGTAAQLVNLHQSALPSAALRDRLFSPSSRETVRAAAPPVIPRLEDARSHRVRLPFGAWAAAAAFVLALLGLGSFSAFQYQQVQDLQRDVALLAEEAAEAESRLVAQQALTYWVVQPDLSTITLQPLPTMGVFQVGATGRPTNARGVVMRSMNGENVLVVMNTPHLPQSFSYQAWAWDMQGRPHSLGVFEVDSSGYAQILFDYPSRVHALDAVSVSAEPAGGNVSPSGAVVLAGTSTEQ